MLDSTAIVGIVELILYQMEHVDELVKLVKLVKLVSEICVAMFCRSYNVSVYLTL